jgi:hypothetical protein
MTAVRRALWVLSEGRELVRDAVLAATTLREVEKARWLEGPAPLVARLRERGLKADARTPEARRRLLRVIHHLDRVMTGGANCYRRSLARVALDRESAREPFILGLNQPNDAPRGHAWVERNGEASEHFDVEFRL